MDPYLIPKPTRPPPPTPIRRNIVNLPSEILFDILLNTETTDLAKLCPMHPIINNICNDGYFWQLKLLQDYKVDTIPQNYSWKSYNI